MTTFKLQPTDSDAAMIQQDADNFRELVNAWAHYGMGLATPEHMSVIESFEKLAVKRGIKILQEAHNA